MDEPYPIDRNPPRDDPPQTSEQQEAKSIANTQREVRRLNQESWAIINALREQRRSIEKTSTLDAFVSKVRDASRIIRNAEKSHFRNRLLVYLGALAICCFFFYLLVGNPWRS